MNPDNTVNQDNIIGRQSILVAVDPPSSLPDLTPVLAMAIGAGWTVDLVHALTADRRSDQEGMPAISEQVGNRHVASQGSGGQAEDDKGDDRSAELDAAYRQLAAQAEKLSDERVDVEAHVLVGPAVDVIITAAQMLNSAMIVVAGHRKAIDNRTMLGSFTTALLKVAERPVLVLPAGEVHPRPGFVAALDRLIELIDREEDGANLADLRHAATSQLQQSESDKPARHLGGRLRDALHQFETSHPTLTSAINDVSYYLSGMGI